MEEPIENSKARASRVMLLLALAWGFVGIPLAWGVFETLKKSMSLFR
jgi:hypothetical protein